MNYLMAAYIHTLVQGILAHEFHFAAIRVTGDLWWRVELETFVIHMGHHISSSYPIQPPVSVLPCTPGLSLHIFT